MMRAGDVALVTGAGRGIGRAVALALGIALACAPLAFAQNASTPVLKAPTAGAPASPEAAAIRRSAA